jgi:PTS system cellobiose-specific IIA component
MQGMELTCFQIISTVGTARSLYIEAIDLAKQGRFEEARQRIREGEETYNQGHEVHAKMVQDEANGKTLEYNLLLLHAEDLQMSAENFGILANEFVDLYEKLAGKQNG